MDSDSARILAVKEVTLDRPEIRDRLDDELRTCRSLSHPHLVSYLGHDFCGHSLRIYMEYVPGGSMADFLSEFGPLGEHALRKATLDTLVGLDYLHSLSPPIAHGNLKGANVLVAFPMCTKLVDFGCSGRTGSSLGSLPWSAPEVVARAGGDARAADIWSFGCAVIEMATAEKPWGDEAFDDVMIAMHRIASSDATPPLPKLATAQCRDLIAGCTRRFWRHRPSAVSMLQHTFLSPLSAGVV